MRLFYIVGLVMVLIGCDKSIVRVSVPVPVPCLPSEVVQRPVIHDSDALKRMPAPAFVAAVVQDRAALVGYADEAEAMLKACQ